MQGLEKNLDLWHQFRLFSYLCRHSCILELNLPFDKKITFFFVSSKIILIFATSPMPMMPFVASGKSLFIVME